MRLKSSRSYFPMRKSRESPQDFRIGEVCVQYILGLVWKRLQGTIWLRRPLSEWNIVNRLNSQDCIGSNCAKMAWPATCGKFKDLMVPFLESTGAKDYWGFSEHLRWAATVCRSHWRLLHSHQKTAWNLWQQVLVLQKHSCNPPPRRYKLCWGLHSRSCWESRICGRCSHFQFFWIALTSGKSGMAWSRAWQRGWRPGCSALPCWRCCFSLETLSYEELQRRCSSRILGRSL